MVTKPVLTETELRSYLHCTEFYHKEGEIQASPLLTALTISYETLIRNVASKKYELNECFSKAVATGLGKTLDTKMSLDEQLEYEKNLIMLLNDVVSYLPFSLYQIMWLKDHIIIPITENTKIKLDCSAFLKTPRLQTIHIVTFTPFNKLHSILNDPTNFLKVLAYKDVVNEIAINKRPNAVLHIFGIGINNQILYYKISSNDIKTYDFKQVKSIIKTYESQFHAPLLNCNNDCIFKPKCFPSGIKYD